MALQQIKALCREVSTMVSLQEVPPCVTFYAEDDFSYLTMEGYVEGLLEAGETVAYLTSAASDPLLERTGPKFRVFALPKLGLTAVSRSKAPVLVMTMPDLGALHVARPAKTTRCVYLFHALVSVQRQYRTDAFDHYDDFFCTGEYQVQELTRRFELLGKPCPRLHKVGYYKLDRMHHRFREYHKRWTDRPTVLLAPSWHPGNLLEACGLILVEQLLAADVRVVVRPHPAFFSSIYPKGRSLVAEAGRRFSSHPFFVLDTEMGNEQYFHEADLLITDWSGSAYEYAFATERPVLFVDAPAKIRNPRWQEYGIVPFEVAMRDQVGRVMKPDQADEVATLVGEMLAAAPEYRDTLRALREREIFNFGTSAQVGTRLLQQFLH